MSVESGMTVVLWMIDFSQYRALWYSREDRQMHGPLLSPCMQCTEGVNGDAVTSPHFASSSQTVSICTQP